MKRTRAAMISRRGFLSTTVFALASLATGCIRGLGGQLSPWQVHHLSRDERHALEETILEEDDSHSNEEHQEEIESHLVSIYSQHPQRDTYYAATGFYLTDGIVLTVDHAVRDTFLADPRRRHFIEHRRRQRLITSMLARHPRYDLALLKIEDDHFLDQIHVHPRDPHNDMALHVIAYQNNQYLRECTHVISNSDIAFTAAGERHIDMFRIRRSFGYGWSGAVVVNYARGHLIGLVSSSSQRQHVDYSSCSRAVHIDDI